MYSLLKHYGASYRNRSPFKSWGKSMCSMFISTKKCHCYLHFEQIETLSYVMSLQARGILVNFPLFFRGQLNLLRLGFVGSLSTFLPKDSCLGARQETSHQWPCTFGWGKLLEDNPRLFSSMQIGAILYNAPGCLLCLFLCFVEWGVRSLSTVWVNKHINWMRVLKEDCEFLFDEDNVIFRCESMMASFLTSQTETSTQGRKTCCICEEYIVWECLKIGDYPRLLVPFKFGTRGRLLYNLIYRLAWEPG